MNVSMKWLGHKPKAEKVETTLLRAEEIRDPEVYYRQRAIESLQKVVAGELDRRVWEQATELTLLARRNEL